MLKLNWDKTLQKRLKQNKTLFRWYSFDVGSIRPDILIDFIWTRDGPLDYFPVKVVPSALLSI